MNSANRNRRNFVLGASAAITAAAFPGAPLLANTGRSAPIWPALVGKNGSYTAKHEDTLLDIARNHGLGYVEIVAANPGVDPWLPGKGTEITLPTAHLLPQGPRKGVLLNLQDQRLYYFAAPGKVETFPIGTGREAWNTPLGNTKIVRKKKNPTWYVPASVREEDPELPAVVRPGPDNPLGRHALYLGWQAYLIHGTNKPWGVGRRVSHGCIRMYPEDISGLFDRLPIGTPVSVINQEAKIGWSGNELLLEIHPNGAQNLELEESGKLTPAPVPELSYRIKVAAGEALNRVNWKAVKREERERRGIPVNILNA